MNERAHPTRPPEPTGTDPGHYHQCGECARCASGTARRPNPRAADCYDAWLATAATRRPA